PSVCAAPTPAWRPRWSCLPVRWLGGPDGDTVDRRAAEHGMTLGPLPVDCFLTCVKTLALAHSFVRWCGRAALVPEQAQERKLRHGLLIPGPLPQKLDHKGEHDREERP